MPGTVRVDGLLGVRSATLEKVTVIEAANNGYGFSVVTGGNTFTGNKAKKSGIAHLEDTAGKGANTYAGNAFGTSEGP